MAEAAAAGQLDPGTIGDRRFAAELFTGDIPDPDLVIRTSGERRISNFLLWQSAYSELVFFDKYWPDFVKEDLAEAVRLLHKRDRRYGAALGSGQDGISPGADGTATLLPGHTDAAPRSKGGLRGSAR